MTKSQHNIEPIYDSQAKILILGSFPSVKSRAEEFYYAHPQNRFWRLLALVLSEPPPQTKEQKTKLLLKHQIALWDVAAKVEIEGSADSSLDCLATNDLGRIFEAADIRQVYCNGAKAWQLYHKLCEPLYKKPAIKLPSTSPANAAWNLARLRDAWQVILTELA